MPSRTALRFAALRAFLRGESAGGAMLITAGLAAMVWANSPLAAAYRQVWDWAVPLGPHPMSLRDWVNDGLMALFFLLVGLELRREVTRGELASARRVAAPGLAALGGMAVPALVFWLFNRADPEAMRGWAVPVATDIAFALAVIGLAGRRAPMALKLFLTALAVMDDLGAIVVIALFYSRGLHWAALAGSAGVWLALLGLARLGVRRLLPYLVGAVALWLLVFQSGVHATLAGVVLAFVVPAGEGADGHPDIAERLERALAGPVAFLVLPLFGLANAGLDLAGLPPGALTSPLALGTALALVVGKQAGVFGTVLLAARLGLARLPAGISLGQLYGAAVLCGIGFTMSLFIGDLAFAGSPLGEEAKAAIFVGSAISAVLGLLVLALAPPARA